jgi:LemA protein
MSGLIVVIVIAVLVALAAIIAVGIFNGLVRSRNRVAEAWSGVDVQLRRRASLIPNLVETVKGYAEHERETFEEVTRARAMVEQAGDTKAAGEANNMLTGALGAAGLTEFPGASARTVRHRGKDRVREAVL